MNIKKIQILSDAEKDLEEGVNFTTNKENILETIFGTACYQI